MAGDTLLDEGADIAESLLNSAESIIDSDLPDNPNEQIGFEIDAKNSYWSFIPEFYPDDFTQQKAKKLERFGGGKCAGGESVSIKKVKNREIHVGGVILEGEIGIFNALMDHEGKIDLISPLAPSGGLECYVKKAELGNLTGWDPHKRQRLFEYTMTLISTGRDEYDTGDNAIVTAIINESN